MQLESYAEYLEELEAEDILRKAVDSYIDAGPALPAVGDGLDTAFTKTGAGLGHAVNKTIEISGKAGGALASHVAGAAGASDETKAKVRQIGTVVTAAGLGLAVGVGAADALVGLAAASGTSGAAATTSGLAALGGGAVATGGGGMAVGQAVTQGVAAASAAASVAGLADDGGALVSGVAAPLHCLVGLRPPFIGRHFPGMTTSMTSVNNSLVSETHPEDIACTSR